MQENRARLFPVVPCDSTRGNGHPQKHRKVPLNIKNNFFSLRGGLSTYIGFCFSEGLWCLHPWRYSEVIWTQPWATNSRWLCLSSGQGGFQLSLPNSAMLWIYDMQEQIYWRVRKTIREAFVVEGCWKEDSEDEGTAEIGLRPIMESPSL